MTLHIIELRRSLEYGALMKAFTTKIHRLILISSLLFVTVGCDQATKVLARDSLKNLRTFSYFKHTIVFQYAENTGAFLSLGSALPENLRFWIFTIAVGLFLMFTLGLLFRKNNMDKGTTLALTLLTGGGIGNLIDRLLRGSVTDFIHIGWGPIRTGVFNVADVAIVAGILIYVFVNLQNKKATAV
jgi:signal peptidase II